MLPDESSTSQYRAVIIDDFPAPVLLALSTKEVTAPGDRPVPANNTVTLGLRREQFVACTRSVAQGHVRRGRDKAQVVGNNKAFGVSDKSTLTGLGELKLLAG
jgi:hypothetical protein